MNDFLLMKDSSEGDKGKEAMLDFVLSWTLRVASDAYPDKEVKQTLHKACRRILFVLCKCGNNGIISTCTPM